MSTQLSAREKVLAGFVCGAIGIFLSLFLISFFIKNNASLRGDLGAKKAQLQGLQALLADAPLWQQRDEWVRAHQPATNNESAASSLFLTQEISEAAKRHTVTLAQQSIGSLVSHPSYRAATVSIEAKCSFKDLMAFFYDLQGQEKFVVFESANLQVDTTDNTKMAARLQVAKWYAPK